MKRYAILSSLVVASAMILSGCSEPATQKCKQATNQAECLAWADSGGDINDYLIGGMAGYMMSQAMIGGRPQTIIVADPSYTGTRHLHSKIASQDAQVARLEKRVKKLEAQKQKPVTATKPAQQKSSYRPTYKPASSPRYRPSYRPSYRRSYRR